MRRDAMLRATGAEPMMRRPDQIAYRMVDCPVCGGSGDHPRAPTVVGRRKPPCPQCQGEGEVPRILGGH